MTAEEMMTITIRDAIGQGIEDVQEIVMSVDAVAIETSVPSPTTRAIKTAG